LPTIGEIGYGILNVEIGLSVHCMTQTIASVWNLHSQAEWPRLSKLNEGQLMTLDTVIGGCAVYYLDSAEGLDAGRMAILRDCIADLDPLLDELSEESLVYFNRLRLLAELLLASGPPL
jgi:hypothetical protein